MAKKILLFTVIILFGSCLAVHAQLPNPDAGTVPKSLEADSTRERSVELERIKRTADSRNRQPEAYRQFNFSEIKKDFEQVQLVFDSRVVKTYKSTDPIDYVRISEGSEEIRQRARRLKANLFPEKPKKEKADHIQVDANQRQETVKKLIVRLNDALRSLVTNSIFRNPGVVDPKDSETAKADLDRIILLSAQLSQVGGREY
jgi:hypothetical protein